MKETNIEITFVLRSYESMDAKKKSIYYLSITLKYFVLKSGGEFCYTSYH